MISRKHLIGSFVSIAVFAVAIWVLVGMVREYDMRDVWAAFQSIPPRRIAFAALSTIGIYAIMGTYDMLAVLYFKHKVSFPRVFFASLIASIFSYAVGLALVTGGAVRYRIYSDAGLKAGEIAKIIAFGFSTFTLCLLLISGVTMLIAPDTLAELIFLPPFTVQLIGALLLVPIGAYLITSLLHAGEDIRVFGHEVHIPSFWISLSQILMSGGEVVLTGSVLYFLLPPSDELTLPAFLGLYIITQVVTFAAQIPGGVGVFDAMVLLLLGNFFEPTAVFAAVLAFRILFYVIPLAVSSLALVVYESHWRRRRVAIPQ